MIKTLRYLALALGSAGLASAQLVDLQPGRNFPNSTTNFGSAWAEQLDAADVDNDGDLDVVVAIGGHWGDRQNRIYINKGGLQGGPIGTFVEETATRFAGVPLDASRDIEFVDIERDGDADIYISNQAGSLGQVSRWYVNLGGLQGGTVGYYADDTDAHWGNLVSVPLAQQEDGNNHGAWRDWSCDCDFADIDNDDDLDLFHSSYGPFMDGTEDSRIFLNDGAGVFNELWPWADPAADLKMHIQDFDMADFDGDGDLDVIFGSRDSQSRVFLNNLYNPLGETLFQDITQHAILDSGSAWDGAPSTYDLEFGDIDGDDDFEVWMAGYRFNGGTQPWADSILVCQPPVEGAGFSFERVDNWMRGEGTSNDDEIDFIDYDGDGDLDAMTANFNGDNWLYQSGLAQGLDPVADGLFHRTGTSAEGSQATWPELPVSPASTGDVEAADVDNDGDEDILLCTYSGLNKLQLNVLGVPDTHAPRVSKLLEFCDPADNASAIIVAQVRDNSAYYIIDEYAVVLTYEVDGGGSQQLNMFCQRGQQFRGVIPGALAAQQVTYSVQVTDRAGNVGSSAATPLSLISQQWSDLGGGLSGVSGIPDLAGLGCLCEDTPASISLTNAAPNALALWFISLESVPAPFKGGVLGANPPILDLTVGTDGNGEMLIPFAWPAGLPGGLQIYFQIAIRDLAAVKKVSISNLLLSESP